VAGVGKGADVMGKTEQRKAERFAENYGTTRTGAFAKRRVIFVHRAEYRPGDESLVAFRPDKPTLRARPS